MDQGCCFCAYTGTTRAVKAHIASAHAHLRPPNTFGRPKGVPCPLCGFVHDDIARPGWAIRRKRFERGKVVAATAGVLPGGHFQTIGTFAIPPGARRIARIELRVSPCRGPFLGREDRDWRRFCLTCKRPHFDAQRLIPRKCRFMITRDGRTIQCDLAPGHQGAHEIPSAWREWWETGQIDR